MSINEAEPLQNTLTNLDSAIQQTTSQGGKTSLEDATRIAELTRDAVWYLGPPNEQSRETVQRVLQMLRAAKDTIHTEEKTTVAALRQSIEDRTNALLQHVSAARSTAV